MTTAHAGQDRTSAAIMWLHAFTLLVIAPVLAGHNLTATLDPTAGLVGFLAFAAVGTVMVWRTRNNWGR